MGGEHPLRHVQRIQTKVKGERFSHTPMYPFGSTSHLYFILLRRLEGIYKVLVEVLVVFLELFPVPTYTTIMYGN